MQCGRERMPDIGDANNVIPLIDKPIGSVWNEASGKPDSSRTVDQASQHAVKINMLKAQDKRYRFLALFQEFGDKASIGFAIDHVRRHQRGNARAGQS
jgi:hypothetical protein